jgi:hypothetical protein
MPNRHVSPVQPISFAVLTGWQEMPVEARTGLMGIKYPAKSPAE